MPGTKRNQCDPARFFAAAGVTQRPIQVKAGHVFFSQGGHADLVFFLDSGHAKITAVSEQGKEATVTLLSAGDFIEKIRSPVWKRCIRHCDRSHRLRRAEV